MTSEFFDDDCGKHALQLAAQGNVLIAEVQRLSEHLPDDFVRLAISSSADIMSDFSYFTTQSEFERRVSSSASLRRLDDAFREMHLDFLDRCFELFSGVYNFAANINHFAEDLATGTYHSQTLRSVLVHRDGRQVLCELLHLYGTLLLLLDYYFGGKTREHLLVSYMRYRGTSRGGGSSRFVEVTQLCRSTGFEEGKMIPTEYPVAYFARVPINADFVSAVIATLRTDDIYQMTFNFPSPEHRCSALALQGALAFVTLFFQPDSLRGDAVLMREVVLRHFDDNWVINYYMGFTADLTVAWADFPAAREAISKTLDLTSVRYHQSRMHRALEDATARTLALLHEGTITEQLVLDTIHTELLPHICESNVALRWFILHTTRGSGPGRGTLAKYEEAYAEVRAGASDEQIITLLLATAQLEYVLRDLFTVLLRRKRIKWLEARERASQMAKRLSSFFAPGTALTEDISDDRLAEWFAKVAKRVDKLSYKDSSRVASGKVQRLLKGVEHVRGFFQIDENPQAAQMVADIHDTLHRMFRYTSIENRVLVTLATVGDLSYAWESMNRFHHYTRDLQAWIKQRPAMATRLRSVFMKLSSMLELPCSRVDQYVALTCSGGDGALGDGKYALAFQTITHYYSGVLVAFARRVLHVIPMSIFDMLRKVMHTLTDEMRECPSKIERSRLCEVAQLEARERLSGYTASIAQYASGILAMRGVTIGVVDVKSHELLEVGIQRELVEQITRELHAGISPLTIAVPQSSANAASVAAAVLGHTRELEEELQQLARRLGGARRAFEYVQDYIHVQGLRLWLIEYERIAAFTLQMERNTFEQKCVYAWNSPHQSTDVPIPYFEVRSGGQRPYSFLGRLVQRLLFITDPTHSTYLPARGVWVVRSSGEVCLGPRTFACVANAIDAVGLAALDALLSAMIAKDIRLLLSIARTAADTAGAQVGPGAECSFEALVHRLRPATSNPTTVLEDHTRLIAVFGDSVGLASKVLELVGRVALLRCLVTSELRCAGQLNSHVLSSAVSTLNDALMLDMKNRLRDGPVGGPGSGVSMSLLEGVSAFCERFGIRDVLSKVYVERPGPMPHLVFFLLAVTMQQVLLGVGKRTLRGVSAAEDASIPLSSAGVALLLRQFHSDQASLLFEHLSQAVRAMVLASSPSKGNSCPAAAAESDSLPDRIEMTVYCVRALADAVGRAQTDVWRCVPLTLVGGGVTDGATPST